MNRDRRMRQLLNDYAEHAPQGLRERVQDRLAAKARRSRRAVSFRWAFAGGLAIVLAVLGLTVIPRQTVALKLRKVHLALESARSMRFTLNRDAGGKERPVYWVWANDGKSRRRRCFTPDNDVTRVVKDGKMWTYLARDQVATEEPYVPGADADFDADVDGIELAKQITAVGASRAAAEARIEPHSEVDGRPTYAVVTELKGGRMHAKMVVDEETSLPVSLTLDVGSAPAAEPEAAGHGIWRFSFNEKMDSSLFEPVFGPEVKIVAVGPSDRKPVSESVEKTNPGLFTAMDGEACDLTTLYMLRFGSEPNRIGAILDEPNGEGLGGAVGLGGFAVRRGGSLIVADRVNRRVKEFDIHGNLVLCTEEPIDDLGDVAAGPDGSVLATSGHAKEELRKFDRQGKELWRVMADKVIPPSLHLSGGFGALSVAEDGTVGVGLAQDGWMLTLTKDGQFQSVRIARSLAPDGKLLTVAPVDDSADSIDVITLDGTGNVASKVRLSPVAGQSPEQTGSFVATLPDAQGSWYRVFLQRRSKRLDLGSVLKIRSEAVVTKYAANGKPLAQGVVDASPFGYAQWIAASPDGYMYTFTYGVDRVYVVRYRLP